MKSIIAIDPGAGGGIAISDEHGDIYAIPMPEGLSEQVDTLRDMKVSGGKDTVAVVENVGGYVPGNSGPASVKFARHVGNIEAALYCMFIPTTKVAPQTWMKTTGTLPKDKTARKNAIKELMARKFPHLKVTLKTADALAILCWAMKGQGHDATQ